MPEEPLTISEIQDLRAFLDRFLYAKPQIPDPPGDGKIYRWYEGLGRMIEDLK